MRSTFNEQETRIWEIAFASYAGQLLIERTRNDVGKSPEYITSGHARDLRLAHLHADIVVMDYRKLKAETPHAGKEGP